jgi:integrase
MPTVVSRVRRSSRPSRVPGARRPVPSRAQGVVPAAPTFAEIAAQYLERHIERYLVPRAAQLARYAHAYLATVKVPKPGGGSMLFTQKPFRQITTADVEEAIERKAIPATKVMRRGAVQWTRRVGGGPTANRLHAHLRGLWRWAIVKGYCDATPFARAGLPTLRTRPEQPRARRLTRDEAARLLAACSPHLRDVVIAALETGCRKQELLSLQWQQVHWAQNELYLPGAKTKTKRPRRIPISAALHEMLVRRQRNPAGQAYGSEDYVWGTDAAGTRTRDIKTAWTNTCRRAGIRGLRFHDLRHEAASRKVEAGYPMHAVSLWLGHTNLTTTARYLNADVAQLHALNDRPVCSADIPRARSYSQIRCDGADARRTGDRSRSLSRYDDRQG